MEMFYLLVMDWEVVVGSLLVSVSFVGGGSIGWSCFIVWCSFDRICLVIFG